MPAEFTLGTSIFNSVDEGLQAVFSTGLQSFANLIAPIIGTFVSLYFVFVALNYIFTGNSSELPVGEWLKRMFYMVLFTLFAFNIPYYYTVVVVPVGKIGAEIAEAFAATGSTTPQIIDQMGNQIIATVTAIWENMPEVSFTNINIVPMFKAIGTMIIVFLFGGIFMVVSFMFLMVAKIMVSMVLLLGPLYISFAFFPLTREYFMKWLGQLMNYTLLYALFGIAFTLLTNMLQKYVSGEAFSNILVGDLTQLKLIFCYLLFSGVIFAIPMLSSHLTGGVGINGLGAIGPMIRTATGAVGRAFSAATSAASGGARGVNQISGGGGSNRRLG